MGHLQISLWLLMLNENYWHRRYGERMTFERFVNQRREHYRTVRQNRRPHGKDNELKRATEKLSLTTFDGSSRMTAQAWIHKLDTFLALRPMTKVEAIKYATLHLEGATHDWWYHGMVTLQHNQVTSYQDFMDRLVERFDKKDPEVYFRELA